MASTTRMPTTITRVEQKERNPTPSTTEQYLRVTFDIGSFGPYWIDVPAEGEDEKSIIKLVQERADTIKKILMLTEG